MSYLQGQTSYRRFFISAATLMVVGLLALLPLSVLAQDDLNVHGVVSNAMTSSKLADVKVTVNKNGTAHNTYTTRANGKYEFYLDCNANYEFVFEKTGFVKRSLIIDARNIPQEIVGAGIIMPTDMSMYEITEAMEGEDLSVFNQPIGKASYDPAQDDLVWDFNYTNKVKTDINNFIRDVEKREKEMAKEQAAAEKAAAQQEAKFIQFVKDGDAAAKKLKYDEAVIQYQAALGIKPDAGEVTTKLADVQAKLEAQKAQEKLDSQYSAALDAADGYMRAQEYQKAIDKFNEALELKPAEKYPKEQIVIATKTLEEELANRANQDQFNDLMTEGENYFKDKKYDSSLEKYNAAQKIFPDNKEVAKRINTVNQAIADEKALAAKQSQYDEFIASADQKFKGENFQDAISDYKKAGAIFPDEAYPKERITAAEEKIQTLADAAKLRQDFEKLVADGDAALGKENYQKAIDNYTEALELISDDNEVKTKLVDAKGVLAEKEAAAKKQENYNHLIQEADGLYQKEEFAAAKSKYQEARELIPEENYPMEQITQIDRKLQELAESQKAQETYDAAMAAGRAAIEKQNYSQAISKFEEALAVFKNDKEATDAIKNANALWNDQKESNAKLEAYNAKITEADAKMAQEDYEEARKQYTEAQKIKPDVTYPQSQIDVIDATLAQNAAEAEKLKQINALIAEGDDLVGNGKYEPGIVKYNEALVLGPSRGDIQPKIDAAMKKMLAFQEAESLEAAYENAIKNADNAFDLEKWTKATSKYEEALNIKPEESYPKNRIKLIEEKIAENEAAAKLADEQRLQAEFNEFMAKGDKAQKQKRYEDALGEYGNALAIMPDNEEVLEKIEEVNAAISAQGAKETLEQEYYAHIQEADALFIKEDYESAKGKYTEALELKPGERHPANRISEIDVLLEKERLASLASEADALEKQYTDALKSGDNLVLKEKYEDAIDAYNNALEIKPDETYPRGQIERVNLLIQSRDEAAAQAALEKEKAALKEKQKAKPTSDKLSRVNTSSEDQAEQFMRDAREAQENEKYERIKQLKSQISEDLENREQTDFERRQEELNRIEELKSEGENRFAEAEAIRKKRIKNSEQNKDAVFQVEEIRQETRAVLIRDNFSQLKSDSEKRKEWFENREAQHEKEVQRQVDFKQQQIELIQEWAFSDENKRADMNDRIQEMAEQRYLENQRAEEIRAQNSEDLKNMQAQIYEKRVDLTNQEMEKLKKWTEEMKDFENSLASTQKRKGEDKVSSAAKNLQAQKNEHNVFLKEAELMADKRRMESLEEFKNLRSSGPKAYDEYYRSQLAENYPIGVSEESSTQGNKVIITRIVVKGNKGDEYKKVLDIAGNYYFKNGQSISETTWNRETISAYNKKD